MERQDIKFGARPVRARFAEGTRASFAKIGTFRRAARRWLPK